MAALRPLHATIRQHHSDMADIPPCMLDNRPDDIVEVLGRAVGGGCLLVAPLCLLGPRVLDVDLGGRHVGE